MTPVVRSRRISLVLGLWASAAFLALWAGVVLHALGGGRLAGDGWVWLTGLAEPWQFIVWVGLLPVAVALWASQTGVPPIVGGAVAIGLVLWTAVAWVGLARTLRPGRRR